MTDKGARKLIATGCYDISPRPAGFTLKWIPEGKEWKDAFGGCVPVCGADQVLDFGGTTCQPIKIVRHHR